MLKREIRIVNKLGLHARAAAKLTQIASRFPCDIAVVNAEQSVNASSRMRVTAANPRLATGLRAPSGESLAVAFIWGRCRQAWRKPCLKAQFCVKSFQPLFSCFHRS